MLNIISEVTISVREIPTLTAGLQRAKASHILDDAFVSKHTQRLSTAEERYKAVEPAARTSAQDGNLSALRDALDAARFAGVASEDLAPYRSISQDMHARLQIVREIVVATKDKHHTKLQQALEKAKNLGTASNSPLPEGETGFRATFRAGETGVHKMLREAMQSGSTVLSHLESLAQTRAVMDLAITNNDKAALEESIVKGTSLGMSREVLDSARTALKDMDRVKIKCHLNTDIRIVTIARDAKYPELKSKIEQTYGMSLPLVMKYKDEVGDLITLASQEDLVNALHTVGDSKLDIFLAVSAAGMRNSVECMF